MKSTKLVAVLFLAACGSSSKPATTPAPSTTAAEPAPTSASAPAEKPAEPAAPAAPAAPAKPIAEKMQETSRALVDGWNAHDADKVMATYAADGVLTVAGMPPFNRDMIKAAVEGELTAFPDFKVGVSRAIVKDHTVVLEWVVTGTNTGDAPDMKATKRAIGLHGAEVLTFDDAGLIKEDHRYFDVPTQMMQLDAKAKKGTFRPIAERPSGEPAMLASTDSADEQKNLEVVKSLYAAIDAHKTADVIAIMSPTVEGDDWSMPTHLKGTKPAKTYLDQVFKAMPDVKQDITFQAAAGDIVVTEGYFHGTLKGKLGSLKPTGKEVGSHFVDIQQIKDGKIVAMETYANSAEMMPPPAPAKAPAKDAKGAKK